jgi:hypothetical protein
VSLLTKKHIAEITFENNSSFYETYPEDAVENVRLLLAHIRAISQPAPVLGADEGWRNKVAALMVEYYAAGCIHDMAEAGRLSIKAAELFSEVREIDAGMLALPEPDKSILPTLEGLDDLTKNEKLQLAHALIKAASNLDGVRG